MKKKVKDLTREEFDKICAKQDSSCCGCTFNQIHNCRSLRDYLTSREWVKFLNQEIEVDGDE